MTRANSLFAQSQKESILVLNFKRWFFFPVVQGFPLYLAQARQMLYQQSPSPSPSLFCTFEAGAESEREGFVWGVGYRKACAPALGRCQEEATEISSRRKKEDLTKAYLLFFLLVYDCSSSRSIACMK